jgi:sugar lactone lactonase YvrE
VLKVRSVANFAAIIMAASAVTQAQSVGLASLTPGVVTTYAGGGTGCTANKTSPFDGCEPNQINLNNDHAMVFDAAGNLYIAEGSNHRIRKITPAGAVSTVAGNGTYNNSVGVVGATIGDNGPATSALVNQPVAVAVDSFGNIYMTDYEYELVRVVYEAGTTLANLILLTNPTLTSVTPGYIYTIAGNGTYPVVTGLTGAVYGAAIGDGGLATKAAFSNSTNVQSGNDMCGIAVDSAGNVYVADGTNDVVRKITASTGIISLYAGEYGTGGTIVNGTPANADTSASGIGLQRGLAIDAAGDLFLAGGNTLMINGPNTTATTPGLGFGYAPGTIHIIAGGGGTSGYAGPYNTLGTLTRYGSPRQITIDPAGDLYNNDNTYDRITKLDVNDIVTLVEGNAAQTGTTFTAADPPVGLGGPATSAETGSPIAAAINPLTGDLYVLDPGNNLLYDVSAPSSILAFGSQSTYVNSAAQTAIVSNVGAGALQLSGITFSSTAEFSQVYSGSTDCTPSTLLQPGQSCKIAVVFTPNATGAATATITITDNSTGTAGTAQTITLTGTGTTTATTTTLTATPATASANAPVVLTAVVAPSNGSGASTVAPSGQVTFYSGTTALTPAATLNANGVATLSTTLPAGSYTNLTAIYPGNAVYLTSTSAAASVTVLGTAATATTLSVSSQTILPGGSVTFTTNVTSASGTPTGSVTFFSGSTALTPTETLTGGIATYTTTTLATGCSAITAVYQGSSTYTTSTSAVKVVCVNANDLPVAEMIPGIVSTFAGSAGTSGDSGDGGAASAALLNGPTRAAFDSNGNLYIADTANNTIRKIAATSGAITASSTITVLSGTEGVAGAAVGNATTAAKYQGPRGIAFDSSGNLYIADSQNNAIRKITASSGSISSTSTVSSFAGSQVGLGTYTGAAFAAGYTGDGGQALSATLNDPRDVAVDKLGNIFIADYGNNVVRMVNGASTTATTPGFGYGYGPGVIHTVAGSGRITSSAYPNGDGGLATYATFGSIAGIATDINGNLYIGDAGNNVVRVVNASTGIIATYAGQEGIQGDAGDGGLATAATLTSPSGLSFDAAGNLYIADSGYSVVREVTPAGNILTVAGTGVLGSSGDNGPSTSAKLTVPVDAVPDGRGNIYIVDSALDTVRQINGQASAVTFPELADGVNSAPITVTVDNPGGQVLNLSGLAFSSTVFTQSNSGTGSCTAATVLNPGASCAISIVANSTTQGTETGTLTVTDNSRNTTGSQQVTTLSVQTIPVPSQTINWTQAVGPYTYGQMPVALTASATSGLSVTYTITSSSPANIASISGSTLTINGVGTVTITASQAGVNLQWLPAPSVSRTVVIHPALLTVTAQNISQSTGIPIVLPTPSYIMTGFQFSDTQASSTSGSPVVTPTCTSSSPSGTYPINVTQGTLVATTPDYVINASSFVSGVCTLAGLPNIISWPTLSSNPVVYSATPYTVAPATASSGLTVTYSVASGPGTIAAGSNQLTLKGSGAILIAANQAGNYNSATNPNGYGVAVTLYQTLNVTQAPLTVTANNATRAYGTPNPVFTDSITGTVGLDTFVVSNSTTPSATVNAAPGVYAIQPSVTGGSNVSSYSISYAPGTLTISQATPGITIASTYTSFGYATSDPLTATLTTAGGQGVLPTGSVSFYAGTSLIGTATINSGGIASLPTGTATPIPAGLQTVTAVYSGDTNYTTVTSSAITLYVKANTTTSIASSATAANLGSTVTFTATVVPTVVSNAIPTGSVTFAYTPPGAGTATTLATVAVSPVSGVATATLPVSILPIGTDVVTALYTPGDNLFYASSAAGSLNEVISQEFTLSVPLTGTPANTVTVTSGQTAQLQGTVTGNNGFVQPVSLTCTGMPANATCNFSQTTVIPTALGVQFNILISTAAVVSATDRGPLQRRSSEHEGGIAFAGLLFGLGSLWFRRRTVQRFYSRATLLLLLAVGLCGFASLSGCGENGPYTKVPQGSSQITVTGTSGTVSYNDTFTLVVQ